MVVPKHLSILYLFVFIKIYSGPRKKWKISNDKLRLYVILNTFTLRAKLEYLHTKYDVSSGHSYKLFNIINLFCLDKKALYELT